MSEASNSDDGVMACIQARPEPGPMPWKKLSEEQQQAARRAFALVNSLARKQHQKTAPQSEHLAQVQHARMNQVIMLDGGRGAGKTTLLVTLLYAWLCQRARENGEAIHDASYTSLLEHAGTAHVVPLRILDLRPYPDARELILTIASRLERVIRMLEGLAVPPSREPDARANWPGGRNTELPARTAWRRFAKAASALPHVLDSLQPDSRSA